MADLNEMYKAIVHRVQDLETRIDQAIHIRQNKEDPIREEIEFVSAMLNRTELGRLQMLRTFEADKRRLAAQYTEAHRRALDDLQLKLQLVTNRIDMIEHYMQTVTPQNNYAPSF